MSLNVLTFGCRLNAGESNVIRREALTAGLSDIVVVNTCAVTAEAVRQCRQTVRRIKRERPQTRIVVTGCAAQIDPASFVAMPEVALVVGNDEKVDVSTWSKNSAQHARASPELDAGFLGGARRGKDQSERHHVGAGNRGASHRQPCRARALLCSSAERMRPPLHLLHHPLWSRQFTLRADGRGGGAGAKPVRTRLPRGRSQRR